MNAAVFEVSFLLELEMTLPSLGFLVFHVWVIWNLNLGSHIWFYLSFLDDDIFTLFTKQLFSKMHF